MDELDRHISIDVLDNIKAESICVSLPEVPREYFDYDMNNKWLQHNSSENISIKKTKVNKRYVKSGKKQKPIVKPKQDSDDEQIVLVLDEKNQTSFFKVLPDGTLLKKELDEESHSFIKKEFDGKLRSDNTKIKSELERKKRKKRVPFISKKCPYCPQRYSFVSKLKDHMKSLHHVTLLVCKVR